MSQSKRPSDPHHAREAERYENPIPSREFILRCFADIEVSPAQLSFRELATVLGIKGQENRAALRKRLNAMLRDGQLEEVGSSYRIVKPREDVEGIVEGHRDGYGFVIVPNGEDVFLSAREMRQVFHGDRVRVRVLGKARRDGLEGQLLEVLQRNTSHLVGRLHRERDNWWVVADNPRINHRVMVADSALMSAKFGDYVVVKVDTFPTVDVNGSNNAAGHIVEVLGEPMGPGVEIDVAIRSFDIPFRWPESVLQEAGRLNAEPLESDKVGRVDLRHLPLVTIDGEDARDFDDAVYCEARKGGGFTLWVAIADVSHYVGIGSALDAEAHVRGTSVYFPGRVVPMLPEAISNGLCSLNPEVDRLCMVCEMSISNTGVVEHYEFYEAVIHSHARLTYSEVARVLVADDATELFGDGASANVSIVPERVMPALNTLYALYKVLRNARIERGAIDFETVETQIIFNAQRKIDDIVPVERNDAHKLIEECMLCANVAAAGFLSTAGVDGLYRVHKGPKPEKLENLRRYLGELGLSLAGGEKPQSKHYLQLMERIAELPNAHLIQIMLLRSLSQAVYDPENEGHFGLAYDAYAHFTSPIRRYPDLLVHRAIKHIIRSRKKNVHVRRVKGAVNLAKEAIYPYDKSDMLALGAHCSMTERRADDATRDVTAWLKCEFLKDRIGEKFSGVVAGVANFGLFVELQGLYVEGLLHITLLGKDYFYYDAHAQRLVGERTRRVYQLGDQLDVRVVEVNLDERKINLELLDQPSGSSSKSARKQVKKKREVSKKVSQEASAKKKPKSKKKANSKNKEKTASRENKVGDSSGKRQRKAKSAAKPTHEKSLEKNFDVGSKERPEIKPKSQSAKVLPGEKPAAANTGTQKPPKQVKPLKVKR